MITGVGIGILEIMLFLVTSFCIGCKYKSLKKINVLSYYWLMMTILTMIWEFFYITNYKKVLSMANNYIVKDIHVWTNQYDLSYVLPWKLSGIFYAEYGAYADKEYMLLSDDWSRVIEGSHAMCCGIFALFCIIAKASKKHKNYLVCMSVSMGTQLMNSILYMANYYIQMRDINSKNYCNDTFPCGLVLLERPFMWVNLFWTVCPLFVILNELFNQKEYKIKNRFIKFTV